MKKQDFSKWCEVECSKYILSTLGDSLKTKLSIEAIIILLYKKHEYEVYKMQIAQINDPLNKLNQINHTNNLFPLQKEFLLKLGISVDDNFLKNIIELEVEYNNQFEWDEDEN